MLGAAHKPGAMPLRPLGLGDIYDAAFRIIRFNPQATVGAAVLVSAVTMMIPVVVTTVLSFTLGLALTESGEFPGGSGSSDAVGSVLSLLTLFGSALLLQIGLVLVTGMVAHVTAAAAVGKRLSLSQAWAATHGRRWRLIGLMLLLSLIVTVVLTVWIVSIVLLWVATESVGGTVAYGILTGLLLVVPASCWFWVRVYYLAPAALMLDRLGVVAAIGRGFRLTRGQFWRTFGIALLTVLITSVAAQILGTPFAIAGQVMAFAVPEYAVLTLVITQALTSVITAAFVAPFTSAVASLQYLDQRIRKEGYDVELMSQAGVLDQ